jgi:hypothetical protein
MNPASACLAPQYAVARAHAFQGGHGAVDAAEVGDLGDALELVRLDFMNRREDGHHRVVDPHVDRPQLFLDRMRGTLDGSGIGDVGLDGDGVAAGQFNFALRGVESFLAARDQSHVGTFTCERERGGTADAGRCAGNHDHLVVELLAHVFSFDC